MKRTITAVTISVALLLIHSMATAEAGDSAHLWNYQEVQRELSKKTKIPSRIPAFMPYAGDKEQPLFALITADQNDYVIQLAFSENCEGGNYCHVGLIRGSKSPFEDEGEGKKVPVQLRGGLNGYFIDATCGAHCDDSELLWNEGAYYYSIAMKAERKNVLLRIVNSSIPIRRTGTR